MSQRQWRLGSMKQPTRIASRAVSCFGVLLLLSARTLTPAVSSIGKTVAVSSAPNQSLEIKNPATPIVPSNVAHEPFDLWYIAQAIEGHSTTIAAASVGLQRAMNTDVLRMALSVAESQAGEIQLLKSWR